MPIFKYKKYENEVHLAVWQITESHDELLSLLPSTILTDAELASIAHPQKQVEFFCSRLCISYLAKQIGFRYLGIKKDEYGKPFLVGSDWQMSLTHTTKFVAVVMHPTKSLGIDLEKPNPKLLKIGNRLFSDNEMDFVGYDLDKLCMLWSAKEALYKLYGKRGIFFRENLFVDEFDLKNMTSNARIEIGGWASKHQLLIEQIEEFWMVIAI
ncbi:MAG: 4'-phosphopantetheinyl transferase family protein [Spirosomataceae bacterium]